MAKHNKFIKKIKPWYFWGLGALFYAYENLLQVSQGVMSHQLMAHFKITAIKLSSMSSMYFLSYSLAQIPIGLALDKFGVKKPLLFAIMLCSMGAAIFANATQFYTAEIARLIIGLGSSFAALSCLYLASLWFSSDKFTTLTGALLTIGMVGQILGEKPLAHWLSHSHWQSIMMTLSIFGCCLFLIIGLSMPNKDKKIIDNISKNTLIKCKFIFSHKNTWVVAIYAMLMFTPFLILVSLWGIPFIQSISQNSVTNASEILAYLPIGFAVGAPILGRMSDNPSLRIKTLYTSTILALVSLITILYGSVTSHQLTSTLLFCFGFFCSGFLAAFSIIKEMHQEEIRATALGFTNSLNMLATWALLPLVGYILDHEWHGTLINGIRSYSLDNFQWALSICPILIFIALLLMPLVSRINNESNII